MSCVNGKAEIHLYSKQTVVDGPTYSITDSNADRKPDRADTCSLGVMDTRERGLADQAFYVMLKTAYANLKRVGEGYSLSATPPAMQINQDSVFGVQPYFQLGDDKVTCQLSFPVDGHPGDFTCGKIQLDSPSLRVYVTPGYDDPNAKILFDAFNHFLGPKSE